MKTIRSIIAALTLSVAAQASANPQAAVSLPHEDFFPEGIAMSEDGIAFVGSLSRAEIWSINTADGKASLFAGPEADLMSVVGVYLNAKGSTLYVCSSDPAQKHNGRVTELVAFDVATKRVVQRHAFPGGGLCNDIYELSDGTILATDSANPRIMGLNTKGEFKEWLRDERFQAEGFALNGITTIGETLFVGVFATGELFAIKDASHSPKAIPIELSRPLSGPDGIEALENGDLLVVEGQSNSLSRISLSADHGSGVVTAIADGFKTPTTVAVHGGKAFVVEGQLGRFFGMDSSPAEPFELAVVSLDN